MKHRIYHLLDIEEYQWVNLVIFPFLADFFLVCVDIDYVSIAASKDHLNKTSIKPKLKLERDVEVFLSGQQGVVIEDRNGTLIAIHLPNALNFFGSYFSLRTRLSMLVMNLAMNFDLHV